MQKSKKLSKKTKKTQSNLSKILSIFLALTAIGGTGYILYDLFQPQISKSIEKNLSIPFSKTLYTTKTNLLLEEEIIKDLESSSADQQIQNYQTTDKKEHFVKTTNFQKVEKDQPKEKPKKPQPKKVFFYTVRNDNLVFSSKEVEIEVDSIYEVFKQLKKLKSTENQLSFIPLKVKLIEYKTNEDTLILNLSKDIENNEYGSTGILYSIYQIAYSLGNYTQSKKVLILIEGTKPKYLGGEGIIFNNPIDITRKPDLSY